MFCSPFQRWFAGAAALATTRIWTAVSYNVQALPSTRPLPFVLRKLQGDIIALQGTGSTWGWPLQREGQSNHFKNVDDYVVFTWPVNLQSPAISRHCGIILALRRQFLPKKAIIRVIAPPEELQGRIGGLRVRLRCGPDFSLYNLYFPPPSFPNSASICNKM